MKILVSNDDGIFALGLRTLATSLESAGHEITVVAPDRERSATGHGLTIHQPLRAEAIENVFPPQVKAWSCSGTPSDCVKLALGALLEEPPDLVVSGINHGANLGTDVLYSGTVSAAMEGVMEGIPSIAFSLTSYKSGNFATAGKFAQVLVEQIAQEPLPELMLLNVNVPPIEWSEVAGVIVTRQGIRRYFDSFQKRVDPRGKTYYWLAGEAIEEVDQPDNPQLPAHVLTDVQGIQQNYITITPLQYNLTNIAGINSLETRTFHC